MLAAIETAVVGFLSIYLFFCHLFFMKALAVVCVAFLLDVEELCGSIRPQQAKNIELLAREERREELHIQRKTLNVEFFHSYFFHWHRSDSRSPQIM